MLFLPRSPPLSSGTERFEIKKLSVAGTRQLWALGPGRWGPFLTEPVHSLPGLRGWESHYHLAAEPDWSKEGHSAWLGSLSPSHRMKAASRPVLYPGLTSCYFSPAAPWPTAQSWLRELDWGELEKVCGKGGWKQHRDIFISMRKISMAFALTFMWWWFPELWARGSVYVCYVIIWWGLDLVSHLLLRLYNQRRAWVSDLEIRLGTVGKARGTSSNDYKIQQERGVNDQARWGVQGTGDYKSFPKGGTTPQP